MEKKQQEIKQKEPKKYALIINGGIGKELAATSLVRWLKEKEPDSTIYTISGYPDVFLNNPSVKRNLHFNTPYLEDDYINDADIRSGEPYQFEEYRLNEKHLNELWPQSYRFSLTEYNKNIYPEICVTKREERNVENAINAIKTGPNIPKDLNFDNIIMVQFEGGPIMDPRTHQPIKHESQRNLKKEVAEVIIREINKAGYIPFLYKQGQQYSTQKTITPQWPLRLWMVFAKRVKAYIGIDSSGMHIAASWKKPGLVFWQQTHYKNLGYPCMKHLWLEGELPMSNRPRVGYMDSVPGGVWEDPHDDECRNWDVDDIMKTVREFLKDLKAGNPPTGPEKHKQKSN